MNHTPTDPSKITQEIEVPLDSGERQKLRSRMGDLFWLLLGSLIFSKLGYVVWTSPMVEDTASKKEILLFWMELIAFPLLFLGSIIGLIYHFYCIVTKKTIIQEERIEKKINSFIADLGKSLWPLIKFLLIAIGGIIILMILLLTGSCAFAGTTEFISKTPGWALIIIVLLIVLIVKNK